MNDIENYKQNRINKIIEDPYIKEFLNKNNISVDKVKENFAVFDECFNSVEICRNCTGFETCKQRKRGELVGLSNNGYLSNTIICCKYFEKILRLNKHGDSYVYSDVPLANYEVNLKNISLDEKELKNLYALCYKVFDGTSNKGLYIYGDLGVGKTYMCISLANSLVLNNKKVSFIKINDFVTKMSQLIREDASQYEKTVNMVKKSEYLFVDDIGSETVTDFSRDRLMFNILDYRMENKLCTFFTSNLNKKALSKHFSIDQDSIKTKRLMERIDILCDEFCLLGENKRRTI